MILANFLKILKSNRSFVFALTVLFAAGTFFVSVFLTPQYSSEISVLVIQKQPIDKIDAFSAAKSAEYLSDIFSKAIFTDSFIDDVLNSPLKVKNNYSKNREDRKKEWEKKIKVKRVNNTGILKMTVYDPSAQESQKIAEAIIWNLTNNNTKYHGGGDKVVLNLIDGPTVSKTPTPNVWLNGLVGLLIGFVLSVGFLYFHKKDFIEGKKSFLK
jgi:capsular polysaccharide biosynthesis protein